MSRKWSWQRMLLVGALAAPAMGAEALAQTPPSQVSEVSFQVPGDEQNEYFEVGGASNGYTFNTNVANGATYWVVALENEGAGVVGDEGIVDMAVKLTGSASASGHAWASTANETYSGTPNAIFTEGDLEGSGATYLLVRVAQNAPTLPAKGQDWDEDDDGSYSDSGDGGAFVAAAGNWVVLDSVAACAETNDLSTLRLYALSGVNFTVGDPDGNSSWTGSYVDTNQRFAAGGGNHEGRGAFTEIEYVGRTAGGLWVAANVNDDGANDPIWVIAEDDESPNSPKEPECADQNDSTYSPFHDGREVTKPGLANTAADN